MEEGERRREKGEGGRKGNDGEREREREKFTYIIFYLFYLLLEKTHLATWGFAYHVIPANEYEKIFEKHAQPTLPHIPGVQPYNRWHVLETTM